MTHFLLQRQQQLVVFKFPHESFFLNEWIIRSDNPLLTLITNNFHLFLFCKNVMKILILDYRVRTTNKYRSVYTEQQRFELEQEV